VLLLVLGLALVVVLLPLLSRVAGREPLQQAAP
jgi:hypothetical protein